MPLAALLAHFGCVRSTFYLDDWTQIVQNDHVDQGIWWGYRLRSLTYLTYFLTYRAAGMSAPVFHLENLLLHAGVALALLGFARDFLIDAAAMPVARARRIAGWSALLFAVHPLCSEIPNYTRARDIEFVSLFCLLAAWATVRWRRGDGLRWSGATVLAICAATFSKEVGMPLAIGTVILIGWSVRRRPSDQPGAERRWWKRKGGIRLAVALGVGAVAIVVLIALMMGGQFVSVSTTPLNSFRDRRFGWHIMTQARVFWMYLARVALPIHLCSDHQIAWTVSMDDVPACLAVLSQAALVVVAGVAICWRRRPAVCAAGALAAVILMQMMHRLANVSDELMVEYRMYTAMLFICMALVWGADAFWRRLNVQIRLPAAMAYAVGAAVICACIVLSELRTLDWRTPQTLVANIVAQYPLQARARQEIQEADIRAGQWQGAIDCQPGIRSAVDGAFAWNAAQSIRKYDPQLLTLVRIISEGNVAICDAHLGRRKEAFAQLAWLRGRLEVNRIGEPFFWWSFYYASGVVHAQAGERDDALLDLRESVELMPQFEYVRRQYRRYLAGETLP